MNQVVVNETVLEELDTAILDNTNSQQDLDIYPAMCEVGGFESTTSLSNGSSLELFNSLKQTIKSIERCQSNSSILNNSQNFDDPFDSITPGTEHHEFISKQSDIMEEEFHSSQINGIYKGNDHVLQTATYTDPDVHDQSSLPINNEYLSSTEQKNPESDSRTENESINVLPYPLTIAHSDTISTMQNEVNILSSMDQTPMNTSSPSLDVSAVVAVDEYCDSTVVLNELGNHLSGSIPSLTIDTSRELITTNGIDTFQAQVPVQHLPISDDTIINNDETKLNTDASEDEFGEFHETKDIPNSAVQAQLPVSSAKSGIDYNFGDAIAPTKSNEDDFGDFHDSSTSIYNECTSMYIPSQINPTGASNESTVLDNMSNHIEKDDDLDDFQVVDKSSIITLDKKQNENNVMTSDIKNNAINDAFSIFD
jgi:hypothetical protein